MKYFITVTVLLCFLMHTSILQGQIRTMSRSIQAPQPLSLKHMHQMKMERIQQQNQVHRERHILQAQGRGKAQQIKTVKEILAEYKPPKTIHYKLPSSRDLAKAKPFRNAFQEVWFMLEGMGKPSLKEAIFFAENAFLENKIDKDWYDKEIQSAVEIIEAALLAEGFGPEDDLAKKMMLQRYMSDSIAVRDGRGKISYYTQPKRYDFEDVYGEKDWTKSFVTKLMKTNSGQCHSMPLLYLILAEELGIRAFLALAPQHYYIMLQDDKRDWFNLELTNGYYSSDVWLLSSGYIKSEAVGNGLYMRPMGHAETIAMCLLDLATNYIRKYGYDIFVLDCVEAVLENSTQNLSALQIKANYETFLCQYVLEQLGFPPVSQLPLYPKVYEMHKKVLRSYRELDDLGYEPMPEQAYKEWLKTLSEQQQLQTKFPKP